MISEKQLNVLRGKAIVGKLSPTEGQDIFEYIQALEELLDEDDKDDVHGTEGWRHFLGLE